MKAWGLIAAGSLVLGTLVPFTNGCTSADNGFTCAARTGTGEEDVFSKRYGDAVTQKEALELFKSDCAWLKQVTGKTCFAQVCEEDFPKGPSLCPNDIGGGDCQDDPGTGGGSPLPPDPGNQPQNKSSQEQDGG